jgi:hypothetical protein
VIWICTTEAYPPQSAVEGIWYDRIAGFVFGVGRGVGRGVGFGVGLGDGFGAVLAPAGRDASAADGDAEAAAPDSSADGDSDARPAALGGPPHATAIRAIAATRTMTTTALAFVTVRDRTLRI